MDFLRFLFMALRLTFIGPATLHFAAAVNLSVQPLGLNKLNCTPIFPTMTDSDFRNKFKIEYGLR